MYSAMSIGFSYLIVSMIGLTLSYIGFNLLSLLVTVNFLIAFCCLIYLRRMTHPQAHLHVSLLKKVWNSSALIIIVLFLFAIIAAYTYSQRDTRGFNLITWDYWQNFWGANVIKSNSPIPFIWEGFYPIMIWFYDAAIFIVIGLPLIDFFSEFVLLSRILLLITYMASTYTLSQRILKDRRISFFAASLVPFLNTLGAHDVYTYLPDSFGYPLVIILLLLLIDYMQENRKENLVLCAFIALVSPLFHPLITLMILNILICILITSKSRKITIIFVLTELFALNLVLSYLYELSLIKTSSLDAFLWGIRVYTPSGIILLVAAFLFYLKYGKKSEMIIPTIALTTYILTLNKYYFPQRFMLPLAPFAFISYSMLFSRLRIKRVEYKSKKILFRSAKYVAIALFMASLLSSHVKFTANSTVSHSEYQAILWLNEKAANNSLLVSDPATEVIVQSLILRPSAAIFWGQEFTPLLQELFNTTSVQRTTKILNSFKDFYSPNAKQAYIIITPRTSFWVNELDSYKRSTQPISWYPVGWPGFEKFENNQVFKLVYSYNKIRIYEFNFEGSDS
jgi:hypothetical protein